MAAASDIHDLAAGDLDGDGDEEVVAAVGPWQAFDLRVFRRAGERLELVDRRRIGAPPQARDEWVSTFIDLMNIGEGSFDVVATRGQQLALVDGFRSTSRPVS